MSNVIALVWDFDKTLIPAYMQEPLFKRYGVSGEKFWRDCNQRIKDIAARGLSVNEETYYLNCVLAYARKGHPFYGLNNDILKALGQELTFYEGVLDFFKLITQLNEEPLYRDNDIKFENYIVSTGFKKMIEGSALAPYVKKIWGAEFLDTVDNEGIARLDEVAYSLDNTTKTRALFEISKGVGIVTGNIDVNTKMPPERRRVQFKNMIYIADGPSDVPAFSVMNQFGGSTLAVFPKGDKIAFKHIECLRKDNRVQMLAEADYRPEATASMWIMNRIDELVEEILNTNRAKLNALGPGTPRHLSS